MKLEFAHVCDNAQVTQEGKLCVIGIFSRIFARTVPVTHPVFFVAAAFEFDEPDLGNSRDVTLELIDPEGRQVSAFKIVFNVPGDQSLLEHQPLVCSFPMVPIREFGRHEIALSIDGDRVKTINLEVEIREG